MYAFDPHINEYLAAAEAIHEQTPPPSKPVTYAEGDFVSGVTAGKHWSGHIEWFDGDFITINVGGGWVSVPLADITH